MCHLRVKCGRVLALACRAQVPGEAEEKRVAKYDEQVARSLAGAHATARVAKGPPDYVRVGAGLGSALAWAVLDLADAIRGSNAPPATGERLPERRE
jgi:hypothetical protein